MNTQEAMKILGVIPGDDSREIKRKYHKLISLFHPDSFSNSGTENIHQAQEINEAYRVLSLPVATTKENQKKNTQKKILGKIPAKTEEKQKQKRSQKQISGKAHLMKKFLLQEIFTCLQYGYFRSGKNSFHRINVL